MRRYIAFAHSQEFRSGRAIHKMLRVTATFIILSIFVTIAGCANAQQPMRLPVDSDKLVVLDETGAEITIFSIEIARSEDQRSAGLMFRTDMPKDRGMLFYFPDEAQRFFWMENTPTPLDIVYANSTGQVVHIAKNTTPYSRAPIPSRFPAQYAFEIHAGLSKIFGIKVGHRLVHPAIGKKS